MSDRLREALEQTPDWFVGTSRSAEHHKTIRSAARCFLALTETGPDYEAASVLGDQLMAENPSLPDTIPFYIVCRIVDAALADYLTEEETK